MSRHEGRYDLHMHSVHSDGTGSVAEIVDRVVARQLRGFSLTDHDTTAGQQEAAAAAVAAGIDYITGIELSVAQDDNDIHLLVYGYASGHSEFETKLDLFRNARKERALGMGEKLRELGIEIDVEALIKAAPHGALGRPHLARALIEARAVGSVREAFDRYLATGRPAYLPKYKMTPEEGIALARRAGGVPVLAHPASYPFTPDLGALVSLGLLGVETTYPGWDAQTTAHWRALARRYKLIETGGSDYHGNHRRGIDVGEATISSEMYQRLLTAST